MWKYKDKVVESLEDIPPGTYGFIYETYHIPTKKRYIGKKVLYFTRSLPPLKGTKRKRKVTKESDWRTYYGSHEVIKSLIKEGREEELQRTILQFVPSKKLLTYYETKFLFIKEVLEPNEENCYINDNILAKFFRKDFLNNETTTHS